MKLICYFLLFLYFLRIQGLENVPFKDISECKVTEYFNADSFQCEPCNSVNNLVPTADKLSCTCNDKSIILQEESGNFPKCSICKPGTIPAPDKKHCLPCKKYGNETCAYCKPNEIFIEKDLNGTFLNDFKCIPCVNGTVASESKSECLQCPIINPYTNKKGTRYCFCPFKTTLKERICVPDNLINDLVRNNRNPFEVDLFLEKQVVESLHLKEFLYPMLHLCKLSNLLACQIVANLCALRLYKDSAESPCRLWNDNKIGFKLPWITYGEGDAPLVLNRRKINAQYTFNSKLSTSWLNITSVTYNLNGKLKEIKPIIWYLESICSEFNNFANNGFRFGVDYKLSCIINRQFFENIDTIFLNPYLRYKDSEGVSLYAVPVLIRNTNKGDDMGNWLFVRRFFLTDNSLINVEQNLKYVRYVSSMEIRVKVRDKSEGGKVYPPYMIVSYKDIDENTLLEDQSKRHFIFSIRFEMESNTFHSIEISIGVLAALAILYSGIQTWTHSRRSGKISIDVLTIIRLLVFSCGNLANMFFIIAVGVSVHSFIFYKEQSVVYLLLPNKQIEKLLRNFVIVAFSLKVVEVISLISHQISIDIFLIDWEKPRAHNILMKPVSQYTNSNKVTTQQPVSIWRTYFIANEWNEIQTIRKINVILHLVLVGFTLEIMYLKNWITSEPELTTDKDYLNNTADHTSCIIAVGFLVFLFFYFTQLGIMVGFYERYIKNSINDFVDSCSLANISVFILMLDRYGFYIHGRSVHGFADTDMTTMISQLHREENNLCGHRGLLPESEDQTFRVSITATFRNYYRKLMAPLINSSGKFPTIKKNKDTLLDTNVEKSIQAYNNLNRFLIAFFEHALKDLDYEVRTPLFTEKLLDLEFGEQKDRGVLYIDNGHSFDKVLFYGNELTLVSFELMLFIFVSVLSSNYLLAVFVTIIVYQGLVMIRNSGGRRNLARKTLIDNRFLI